MVPLPAPVAVAAVALTGLLPGSPPAQQSGPLQTVGTVARGAVGAVGSTLTGTAGAAGRLLDPQAQGAPAQAANSPATAPAPAPATTAASTPSSPQPRSAPATSNRPAGTERGSSTAADTGGQGARAGTRSPGRDPGPPGRRSTRPAAARYRSPLGHAIAAAPATSVAQPRARPAPEPLLPTIVQVVPTPVKILIGLLALLALGLAVRARLVAARARRLERQRAELLGDVGLLQSALLPEVPERVGELGVTVAYRPADGPAAGGDFYDVFALDPSRTAVIVGDVMGHGRDALAVTALMRYSLRAYLNAGLEPRIALKLAGRALDSERRDELTTVVVAVYDARRHTLTYACAGHAPPIVSAAVPHEPVTALSSPPLGGFTETGDRQSTLRLAPGDRACFFTDGLVEARVRGGLLGRDELVRRVQALDSQQGASELLDGIAGAAERISDDMAACLVTARSGERLSEPGGAGRVEELELRAGDPEVERMRVFLAACGVPAGRSARLEARARRALRECGSALVRVAYGERTPSVEIEPYTRGLVELPALTEIDSLLGG